MNYVEFTKQTASEPTEWVESWLNGAASRFDPGPSIPKKRNSSPQSAHGRIAKRYRSHLNAQLEALRDCVPSLRSMSRQNGVNEEGNDSKNLEGSTPAHKPNKAMVLSRAVKYIKHLEKYNDQLQKEIATLKAEVESNEKMAISDPFNLHGLSGTPDGSGRQQDPFLLAPLPSNMVDFGMALPPPSRLDYLTEGLR